MKYSKPTHRWLAALLAVAMVITLLPAGIITASAATIKGAPQTIDLTADRYDARENNINKGWKFYLGTSSTAQNQNFDDSGWENVDLPHDFSISQSFTTSGEAESGFLPGGTGWYRKTFAMPESTMGKTILLNFDGVYMHATVYVNGEYVGEHHYGYSNFAFDISDYIICDGATENVIAVKAENKLPSSRWYSGSGIYRDVELLVLDPVHVDLNGVAVTTPDIADGTGTVNVAAEIVNDSYDDKAVTVTNTVYAKGSNTALATASASATVAVGTTAEVTTSAVVANPALWDLDDPNLYTVKTEVAVDGTVVDTDETEFGFRWFNFSSTGFSLNGENVKLNGVCLHHDQGALGSAAYYDAMYRQISMMKEMGANAIRTSHNPADEQFIAICSELGMLVIEEMFDGITKSKNGNSNDFCGYFATEVDTNLYGAEEGMICAEYATRSIVRRDRNAPSIFAWSYGNEIQEGNYINTPDYETYCRQFIQWINDEDGTRIATMGDNSKANGYSYVIATLNAILEAGGVVGFNYHYGQANIETLTQNYGGNYGCVIASETASHVNSRGIYVSQASNQSVDGKNHLTSYDTSRVGWGATAHDSMYDTLTRDYVAGQFVWTGFDYIGEPTPWNGTGTGTVYGGSGATPNSSYFGIVETTGFAKDNYYLYRAQWNHDATTAHMVTAWDADNYMLSGGKVPVWVYTNAAKVELYLNGALVGTTNRTVNKTSAGHEYYTYSATANDTAVCSVSNGTGSTALYSVFNVAYTAGTLSLKAYDAAGNEITLDDSCGKHTVTTPGAVAQLNATADRREVAADGSSLVYIEVDVLDAEGNLDTTATNNITFTLEGEGKILGVDNGDQATTAKFQQASVLTSSKSANINAFSGKALVIVSSTEEAGEITVNVASNGLTGDSVHVVSLSTGGEEDVTGLNSYTMIRDYTVKAGTVPEVETAITGTLADGTTVTGTIEWSETEFGFVDEPGDYTIYGMANFDGYEPIGVSAKLHVLPNVIAMRNISTATTAGIVPTLPSVVNGVLADGTVTGEFAVAWESVDASALDAIGKVVTVNGTATVMGDETLPVTCTIRVAEPKQGDSINIAPAALSVTQDIPDNMTSDNLASINNGVTAPGDNTNERWTNWKNRQTSATATLTLAWATIEVISGVNIEYYYDNCCAKPASVEFYYSNNGSEFTLLEGVTETHIENVNLGARYAYTFPESVNPIAIQVKLTQQNGTTGTSCVGITELEVMSFSTTLEYNTSADLSGITVDGVAVEEFAADTLVYEVPGSAVAATTAVNAGITVLPEYDGTVRILTIAEDGSDSRTYEIKVGEACAHANTEVRGAVDATCTEDGYTGDTWCTDCGRKIATGETIPASGHNYVDGTCTVCGDTLNYVAENTVTAVKYMTLEEALNAAAAGETVKLLKDVADTYVLVSPGTTLDLNGQTLTASYVVGFDTAHVIDSAGTGKLVTGLENVVLDEENAMAAIYVDGAYVFAKVGFVIRQDAAYQGEGIKIQAMAYPVNMAVVNALKDGGADNNVQVVIILSWTTDEGTGSQEFVFTEEVVSQVYGSNGGTWNSYEKAFSMVVTGFENITNLNANIAVVSGTNAAYISSTSASIT